MSVRIYKTITKKQLASAYGFNTEPAIVRRIRDNVHRLDEDSVLKLGKWTGNGHLLPDQVQVLVSLLGNPSEPAILFSEK